MQKRKIKISVIMPAYNVENYIERAIKSILSQSLAEFELIIVDDGSTDGTGKICDKYAKKDKRINVIHKKNTGAAISRNVALNKANGEYVCFFDSDDYIDKNTLNDYYKIAKKYNSEIIISGFYIHTYYDDNRYITLDYIPDIKTNTYTYDNKNKFRLDAYKNFDRNMFYPPWNKLYNLSYIKKHKFKFPNTYRDDFPFVISVIENIERVTFLKKEYYHFVRQRKDSETQKYYKNLYSKRIEEHKMMLSLYKKWGLLKDKNSFEMISRRYIDRIIECIVNLYNNECTLSKKRKKVEITKFLNSKYFDESIKYAKPKKIYLKLMYIPLILKNVQLCALMGKTINVVKKNNIKVFSVLKSNR